MTMEVLNASIGISLNPETWHQLAQSMGVWFYVVLFVVIFCETGLVATPFLPGDSLLFAAGVWAAAPDSSLNLPLLILLLSIAAIAGDAVNYTLGYVIGPKIFRAEKSWFFNKKHLLRAQSFYEKYGSKTIVLARFIPIIRTFAPFVAGIGKMRYRRFAVYNVASGVVWVTAFLMGGYYFGAQQMVKDNFELVVLAIVVLSVLPAVVEVLLTHVRKSRSLRQPLTLPSATAGGARVHGPSAPQAADTPLS